jgi:hypothetical protein
MAAKYADSVFLNVPFDKKYAPLFDALVFAIHDCGFNYGSTKHRQKRCLVLDRERYRYRNFCSDIAGQDVRSHNDQPRDAIRAVRDWLTTHRTAVQMPGGKAIFERYERFRAQLAVQAADVHLDPAELIFGDYTKLILGWLTKNPW